MISTLVSTAVQATEEENSAYNTPSEYHLIKDPDRPRSVFWAPLGSFVLPGLDQWVEGQYGAAAFYSGTTLASYRVLRDQSVALRHERQRNHYEYWTQELQDADNLNNERMRRIQLSSQLAMAMGSFSTYHAFQSAVPTRRALGEYTFIKNPDTLQDIMKAPFEFHFLKRPSTFIPLAIISALNVAIISAPDSGLVRDPLTRSDVFYGTSTSLLAGTHEEALFRGWLLPLTYEQFNHDRLWSNLSTSLIFALMHMGTVDRPIPQMLLGYHLGNVTMDNNWSLREAVFIHAWWDILVFSTTYAYHEQGKIAKLPPILLPPLAIQF